MISFILCLVISICFILCRCSITINGYKYSLNLDHIQKDLFSLFGICLLILTLIFFISFRNTNNPQLSDYLKLKNNYEYVIKNDSIPIEIKYEIYNDLKSYNNKIIDNLSYHNSIWIGYLYPESSYKLKTFDLTKIK